MKTILALIDHSDVTTKVVDQAHSLARAFGSDVILLHVVPPDPVIVEYAPALIPIDTFHEKKERLFALRDSLAARGVKVTAEQYGGPVVETILAHVKPFNPDLIIMGSHGHGALYDLVVGSVTHGVIKHSAWPVMVVPSAPVEDKPPAETPAFVEDKRDRTTQLIGTLGGSLLPP